MESSVLTVLSMAPKRFVALRKATIFLTPPPFSDNLQPYDTSVSGTCVGIEGPMDASTPVESRTKEPLSPDDLSSVANNAAYQVTFDDRSEILSSAISSTTNRQNAIRRRDIHSTKEEVNTYCGRSSSGHQDDSSRSPLPADSKPVPRSGDGGRFREPRPKVSAEARARWDGERWCWD